MKAYYRGYEIDVRRERCLGGWDLLYYSVIRESDGYIALDAFEDSGHTVRELIGHMTTRIDAELEEDDPWGEQADQDHYDQYEVAAMESCAGPLDKPA